MRAKGIIVRALMADIALNRTEVIKILKGNHNSLTQKEQVSLHSRIELIVVNKT